MLLFEKRRIVDVFERRQKPFTSRDLSEVFFSLTSKRRKKKKKRKVKKRERMEKRGGGDFSSK